MGREAEIFPLDIHPHCNRAGCKVQSNLGSPVPLGFRHPFFSPEKLGCQTWSNGFCLYPVTSLTDCAEPLSQSEEAHPNIGKVVKFCIIHMHVALEDNLLSGGENVPTIILKLSQPSWTPLAYTVS